jgi:hypothetical protein
MVNQSFHFNRGHFKEGDSVYYRSPESRYAVRKAKVVQVEERKRYLNIPICPRNGNETLHIDNNREIVPADRGIYIPYDVLTLDNGIVIEASEVFATRQEAEAELISELKERLMFQQVQLENLKQEMAYEEKALRRLEQGQS